MSGPLARNLQALSARDPELAARLAATAPSPRVKMGKARSGAPIPFDIGGGRPLPLHSTVDPEREGKRLHGELSGAGFLVFLGLAGGYHVTPFRADPAANAMLILEKDETLVRSLLEGVDLSDLLGDARVRFLVDAGPPEVERTVLDWYLPAVMGDLRTVPWRPRCDREAGYFSGLARAVARASESFRADYAAQGRFGRRWFVNLLLNLPAAEGAVLELPRSPKVLVAGAGPSLERHLPALRSRRKGSLLIAVDTALPALGGSGVIPDLALSMDCQQYGYHHFFPPSGRSVPRLLDLVSPPVVSRLPGNRGFYAGGHPLCSYLRRQWRAFPALDTSGGNVTHTAVSLAASLGAAEILLLGVDFSYPGGKPYARGTYLSTVFGSRSTRLLPEESSYLSLVFGRGEIVRQSVAGGMRYTTPLLLMYKKSMEGIAGSLGGAVRQADGEGLTLEPGAVSPRGAPAAAAWEPPGPARCGWRDFLAEYCGRLEALPALTSPAGATLRGLPADEREAWSTVLPLVPHIERTSGNLRDRSDLLSASRSWMIQRIRRVLAA